MARKTTKKIRIFYLYRTPKVPGQEGKNAQKNKEFLAREKSKEFQKSKERKDREAQEHLLVKTQFLTLQNVFKNSVLVPLSW